MTKLRDDTYHIAIDETQRALIERGLRLINADVLSIASDSGTIHDCSAREEFDMLVSMISELPENEKELGAAHPDVKCLHGLCL